MHTYGLPASRGGPETGLWSFSLLQASWLGEYCARFRSLHGGSCSLRAVQQVGEGNRGTVAGCAGCLQWGRVLGSGVPAALLEAAGAGRKTGRGQELSGSVRRGVVPGWLVLACPLLHFGQTHLPLAVTTRRCLTAMLG